MTSEQTSAPNVPAVGSPNFVFVGKAGTGKTTAAEFLVQHQGYRKLSFAAPLKAIAVRIWGEPARTDRDKLQKLGKAVREIDADAWVNLALGDMQYEGQSWNTTSTARRRPWVIDDCRFENELTMLQSRDFVAVRLRCSQATQIARLTSIGKFQKAEQLNDSSETALDGVPIMHHYDNEYKDVMELYAYILRVLGRELRNR